MAFALSPLPEKPQTGDSPLHGWGWSGKRSERSDPAAHGAGVHETAVTKSMTDLRRSFTAGGCGRPGASDSLGNRSSQCEMRDSHDSSGRSVRWLCDVLLRHTALFLYLLENIVVHPVSVTTASLCTTGDRGAEMHDSERVPKATSSCARTIEEVACALLAVFHGLIPHAARRRDSLGRACLPKLVEAASDVECVAMIAWWTSNTPEGVTRRRGSLSNQDASLQDNTEDWMDDLIHSSCAESRAGAPLQRRPTVLWPLPHINLPGASVQLPMAAADEAEQCALFPSSSSKLCVEILVAFIMEELKSLWNASMERLIWDATELPRRHPAHPPHVVVAQYVVEDMLRLPAVPDCLHSLVVHFHQWHCREMRMVGSYADRCDEGHSDSDTCVNRVTQMLSVGICRHAWAVYEGEARESFGVLGDGRATASPADTAMPSHEFGMSLAQFNALKGWLQVGCGAQLEAMRVSSGCADVTAMVETSLAELVEPLPRGASPQHGVGLAVGKAATPTKATEVLEDLSLVLSDDSVAPTPSPGGVTGAALMSLLDETLSSFELDSVLSHFSRPRSADSTGPRRSVWYSALRSVVPQPTVQVNSIAEVIRTLQRCDANRDGPSCAHHSNDSPLVEAAVEKALGRDAAFQRLLELYRNVGADMLSSVLLGEWQPLVSKRATIATESFHFDSSTQNTVSTSGRELQETDGDSFPSVLNTPSEEKSERLGARNLAALTPLSRLLSGSLYSRSRSPTPTVAHAPPSRASRSVNSTSNCKDVQPGLMMRVDKAVQVDFTPRGLLSREYSPERRKLSDTPVGVPGASGALGMLVQRLSTYPRRDIGTQTVRTSRQDEMLLAKYLEATALLELHRGQPCGWNPKSPSTAAGDALCPRHATAKDGGLVSTTRAGSAWQTGLRYPQQLASSPAITLEQLPAYSQHLERLATLNAEMEVLRKLSAEKDAFIDRLREENMQLRQLSVSNGVPQGFEVANTQASATPYGVTYSTLVNEMELFLRRQEDHSRDKIEFDEGKLRFEMVSHLMIIVAGNRLR